MTIYNSQRDIGNQRLLRIYFMLALLASIGVIFYLLLIPTDPKSSWLFRYSFRRMVMIVSVLIPGMIVFWILLQHSFARRPILNKIQTMLNNKSAQFSFSNSVTIILIVTTLTCAFIIWLTIALTNTYLDRLVPIMTLLAILGTQSLALLYLWNYSANLETVINRISNLKLSLRKIIPAIIFLIIMEGLWTEVQIRLEIGSGHDANIYLEIADQMEFLYDTGILEPVWIWFVKITTIFAADQAYALIVGTTSLFLITLFVFYQLVLKIFDDHFLANLALFLYGTNVYMNRLVAGGLRDILFNLAVVLLIYFGFTREKGYSKRLRIAGLFVGFFLAVGTRLPNFILLGVFMLYAWRRNQLKYSTLILGSLLVFFILAPYLYFSSQIYGDAMISTNIHAVWLRNFEFVELRQIGCEGCPSPQEYDRNLYLGDPITMFQYIFGMHSLEELFRMTLTGLRTVYLWPSPTFMNLLGRSGLIWFAAYLIGLLSFLFSKKRHVLILPFLLTLPVAFTLPLDAPARYFSPMTPFICLIAAMGIIKVIRSTQKFIKLSRFSAWRVAKV